VRIELVFDFTIMVVNPRNLRVKQKGDCWNLVRGAPFNAQTFMSRSSTMNGLIYLIGLIVVIMFILSFLGLR
jgi:hypothetical protein